MKTVKDGWRLSLGAKSFDSISITFLQDSNLSAEEKNEEQKLTAVLICFKYFNRMKNIRNRKGS